MKKYFLLASLLFITNIARGQTVQCLTPSGAWGPCPLNASVQLFTTQSATGTATATAQKVYNFSMTGNLIVTYASITGSPATCTFQVKSGDSLGNLINNGSTIATTPANGTTATSFIPAVNQQTADQISVVYTCVTYPTTGTLSLEFVPSTDASALDSSGRRITKNYPDTTTASYHTASSFAASSTTDNAVMPGNATNTVILSKVTVTCSETSAGLVTATLIKRSTADTAGTSANMTVVPDDANYAAGASVPKSYTGTGPTVGTSIGNLDVQQFGCNAIGTIGPNDIYIFRPVKPIILRGTAQQVAVNLGNAAIAGGVITVTFDWLETTTP